MPLLCAFGSPWPCCRCIFWKRKTQESGVCWQHGGVTVAPSETCDEWQAKTIKVTAEAAK